MSEWKPSSVSQQVAAHLREGIRQGRWRDRMPGRDRLAAELGVSPWSIQRGLEILQAEGTLTHQGGRRRRNVNRLQGKHAPGKFRLQILIYETSDLNRDYLVELRHVLHEAGHAAEFSKKTLTDLKMNVAKVAAHVESTAADGWIVIAGPLPVLEWFASRPFPTFALFGRRHSVPLAGVGTDKIPAMRKLVRRLTALGHRRIVFLVREDRRFPTPGRLEQAFLDELEVHGIPTGDYHLPHWEDSPEGFMRCLDSLFGFTPPTALILDEPFLFHVAQQQLARRGIFAPEQISLAVCDPDPAFAWQRPQVLHLNWSHDTVVRHVLRWADHVAHGERDLRRVSIRAHIVEGGTVGPAPGSTP